jgi:hypothetical protein
VVIAGERSPEAPAVRGRAAAARRGFQLRARVASLLRDPRVAEAYWWYLVLAVATAAAKVACLASVYRHSDGLVFDEMAARGPALSRPALFALILARDVLDTAGIAAALLAVAFVVPQRRSSAVYRLGAFVLLAVIGVNHVSFLELGTFASTDVVRTAWGWVSLHPQALRSSFTTGAALAAATGLVGIFLPGLLVRGAGRFRTLGAVQRGLPLLALAIVLGGTAFARLATARFGERAFPVHGYWESVARAAWAGGDKSPLSARAPPQAGLLAEYRKLAFVPPVPDTPEFVVPSIETRIRKRHLLVVGLETAARAFYPLTTSPDLPTFRRMTERAIVSDAHYTTSPYTRIANFSMLSGLYAPPSGLPVRFGPISGDGLAAVLRTRGYETSYVDSWVLDWLPGSGEREQARMLGFDTVIDSQVRRDDGVYEVLALGEKLAFDTAFSRIVQAEEHGHKAMVFVGTMLGHSPWLAAEDQQNLDGAARLHQLALVFDGLLSTLLARLEERGLGDDVLILVVGDHGLRYAAEFESLGLRYSHSDLSFNVPFLLYAPGLVDATVHAPFATSHVDITPTLLHLVGESTAGMLHDGSYILDARLAQRVLYLSNSRLGPLDGLRFRGHHFTYHALSGVAEVGSGADPSSMVPLAASPLVSTLPGPLLDPAALLDAFAAHADRTAARLLERGAPANQRVSVAGTLGASR